MTTCVARHSTPEAIDPFDARGVTKRFRDAVIFVRSMRCSPGRAAQFHAQRVRSDPVTMPLMQACLSGAATAAQRHEFGPLWQARVEQLLLVHGFDDAVFEFRAA